MAGLVAADARTEGVKLNNRDSRRQSPDRQPLPRYVKRLIDAADAGLFEPGAGYIIEVAHDQWCPKLAGGPCCCTPDIRARKIA